MSSIYRLDRPFNHPANRLTYSAYCIKTSKPRKLQEYLRLSALESGRPLRRDGARMLASFNNFGVHPLDYYYLRLFRTKFSNGSLYANTWDMYRFQRLVNSPQYARILRDKMLFRREHARFVGGTSTNARDSNAIAWLNAQVGHRIVSKDPLGAAGSSIHVHTVERVGTNVFVDEQPAADALTGFVESGRVLLESFLEQHETLRILHPFSLNTVRVVTFMRHDGEVDFWGALLRIGNGGVVDNFDAGGITIEVDLESGVTVGRAELKDPFLDQPGFMHPRTGSKLSGIQLPHWTQALEMIRSIARANKNVATVGWDLALLREGPAILEGNDNWDKTHFQVGTRGPLGDRIRAHLRHELGRVGGVE